MLIFKNNISEKELKFISRFELKNKRYFTRDEVRKYFTTDNEMGYIFTG